MNLQEQLRGALWECFLASGADPSRFTYETRTELGREDGRRQFAARGTAEEVVEAVRQLRQDYDEVCAELWDAA